MAAETCNKSCKLRCLQGPGRQCQKLNCGACETIRSGGDCGKYRDTIIAQFLLTVRPQYLGLLIYVSNKAGNLDFYVTLTSF